LISALPLAEERIEANFGVNWSSGANLVTVIPAKAGIQRLLFSNGNNGMWRDYAKSGTAVAQRTTVSKF
jgi:hypothetical protein